MSDHPDTCPDCGGDTTRRDQALACADCGAVIAHVRDWGDGDD